MRRKKIGSDVMDPAHRILVMSHGHPDFSLGGGEIAAYNLFQGYRDHPEVGEAWFLARADRGRGPTGAISLRRPNEYLWEQGVRDWQRWKAANQNSVTSWFADLVRGLNPTIVHTHHYAHLGLEYLRVIKQSVPNVRIYMTLHEYMAICRNSGQMVKVGGSKLCSSESFDECRQCFPQNSNEDFWLRKHYFQNYFRLVDGFVAPSEFLRQRYIQWGLRPEQIVVIENGHTDQPPVPPRVLGDGETRNRFAFFGQINPYKGIDLLLEALHAMPKKERKQVVVEVHGANLEVQHSELQDRIRELSAPLIKKHIVRWAGPYRPSELRSRMGSADWVVVPSIWWENSPMVIQEAFMCGRPVISSDIGGMGEKVRHAVDGLHVRTGDAMHWGRTLLEAATTPGLWDQLRTGIERPNTVAECTQKHLHAFAGLSSVQVKAASN